VGYENFDRRVPPGQLLQALPSRRDDQHGDHDQSTHTVAEAPGRDGSDGRTEV
jgi:hypothetical protein